MPYKGTKIEKEKKRELEKLVLRTISPHIAEKIPATVINEASTSGEATNDGA